MDSVKTFFGGQSKEAALTNNQRSGPSLFASRSMQSAGVVGLNANGPNASPYSKMTNHHEVKRKDNDNYFYIMWRS